MKITIVPAYNEESTIVRVIYELKKLGFKVVVVDDGSSDRTNELAVKAGAIVLTHKNNRGKGIALKTGFDYVIKNFPGVKCITTIDADFQYHPKNMVKLIKPIERREADVVMGYRDWRKVPFRHKLGNLVWRTLFNLFFKTKLRDTNCGLMAFSRDSIKVVRKALRGGYIVENSILVEAINNGLKIKQVPVKVNYKKKSGLFRGIKIVLGVSIFLVKEGVKYVTKNNK